MSKDSINEFVCSFISSCLKEGKNKSDQMCLAAENKIKEIDNEINRIERLKEEQAKFRAVIKQLKGNAPIQSTVIPFKAAITDLSQYSKGLCIKICDFVATKEETTPREIMDNVASIDEHIAVYSVIKLLTDNNIIKRHGLERAIRRGESWDNRPS